ncbi:transposase [Succinimonas sp.]|uniref:IS1634 family transposase n=1 Tax=Succinimonas sp. TaxID=1936151 RepID=UPI003864E061
MTAILPEPPALSDTLRVGMYAVLRHIAKQEGLTQILENVHGVEDASRIFDIMLYLITAQSAAFVHYEPFMRSHLMESCEIISDVTISKLLKEVVSEDNRHEMLRQWNKAHSSNAEMIYIGYDSTNFPCEGEISLAEFGAAKEDESRPQVNLAITVSQKDTTPLDYEVYPGSIVDMSECAYMLQRMHDYGYRNVGFMFDRGYYTEPNFKYLDGKRFDFIMMAQEDTVFIRDLISEHAEKLKNDTSLFIVNHDISGITVRRTLYGKERFFHLYYDDVKASISRRQLQSRIGALKVSLDKLVNTRLRKNASLSDYDAWFELEISEITEPKKSKKQTSKSTGNDCSDDKKIRVLTGYALKQEVIKKQLDSYGFFCIVASKEKDCCAVLENYRGRDNIEKFFRSIKWGMDFKTPAVHSDEAAEGKIHLMFLAGILRNRLLQISRRIKVETKNRRSFTVPGIIDQLEMIECTRTPQNTYSRRYALTARQKTILNALGMSEQSIDNEITSFNQKMAGNND